MRKILLCVLVLGLLSGVAHAKSLEAQIGAFAKNGEEMATAWVELETWMKSNRATYKNQGMLVEVLKSDTRLAVTLQELMYDKFSNAALFFYSKKYSFFVSEGVEFAENNFPHMQELAELHFKLLAQKLNNKKLVDFCLAMSARLEKARLIAQGISNTLKVAKSGMSKNKLR